MTVEKNDFNRRVNRRLRQLGIRQLDLAQRTGFSQGRISHICLGRNKVVEAPDIFILADALECDPRWLATGETAEEVMQNDIDAGEAE